MIVYSGGKPFKKAGRYFVVVSSEEHGIQEIKFNFCAGMDTHYMGKAGVCLVCGRLETREALTPR